MDQRLEFVLLAGSSGANISRLATRFGISRSTAYKWIERYRCNGVFALADKSRRPHHSPSRTSVIMEQTILAVRALHPAWGGRKILHRLKAMRREGLLNNIEELSIPAASTITEVLRRHNKLDQQISQQNKNNIRFEYARPNDLWQMDFKGDVLLSNGTKSYPFTVLDDHSRFNLCLYSCNNQSRQTVQELLIRAFRNYGMPLAILADNGKPWSGSHSSLTGLALWLMRLGICMLHGRPYHPQTQGKEERFHRTLKTEVLNNRLFSDHKRLQTAFDRWRIVYNHQRPHEALDMKTPGSRYTVSKRNFPEVLPQVSYEPDEITRKVSPGRTISFKQRIFCLAKSLVGERVAIRPAKDDGIYWVYFGPFAIGQLDLKETPQGGYGRCRIFPSARSARFGEYPCQ